MLLTRFKCSASFLLLCVVVVLSGCYTRNENSAAETEPAATVEQPPAADKAAPAATPAPEKVNVNLYLEISNGMKGFMPPAEAGKEPTVFQSRLNKLISEIQDGRYVAEKKYYLAREDKQGQPVLDSVSYNTMKSTVVSGIRANVLGTPLPDLLKAALEQSVKQNAVSVIISDFIHGPHPDKRGQFISLDSDIRSSLKEAEQQGLAIAVLADASGFYGNYYPAVKKPATSRTLTGEEVPFYIWVIGRQQEVLAVTKNIFRNLPPQQAYFGFDYKDVPFSAILKANQFRPAGTVYCASRNADPCTAIKLLPEKSIPVEFTLGLDLSALPRQLQQENYLKRNLKVIGSGCKASLVSVTAADDAVRASPDLARYTHFLRLQVPQLIGTSGTITLQLPQVQPAWIDAWTTNNDNNPAADPKKTYQLDKIIDGVQALYRDQRTYLFNVTIKFNKAD
ncbi:hypothetical protein [Botryobacter ruber]|uniref:hypothetical protein n=1 Tax=Botryobacter ruber TaxID=2171629 RepID=UPI000FEC3737|nr:hypothetical protein [Botryobacter ruber]